MINTFACIFLFILSNDQAMNDASKISSTHASYDGNTLLLEGNVHLEHALGNMVSEIAHLEKQETNKELPFSKIWLKQNVQMNLTNNGQLFCEIADIDFIHLKGTLLPKVGEQVIYKDKNEHLELLSNSAEMTLAKTITNEKAEYVVNEIRALNEVVMHYEKDFALHSDLAIYNRVSQEHSQSLITCSMINAEKNCTLKHIHDLVFAKSVQFYPNDSKMILVQPKGQLFTNIIPKIQKGTIEFEADLLTWNPTIDTLLLKGNAFINETVLGQIRCDDEIEVKQKRQEEKASIQTIYTKGTTSLKHIDSLTGLSHTLITYGSLFLDNQAGKIHIHSPKIEKEVPEDQQIYYEQGDISMRANDATLQYSINEARFEPTEVLLRGNVHLASLNLTAAPRCALSDQVIYHPLKKELILSANSGKKVLFWDENEGLSISAKQIYITEDELTGKESVKGIGNVSFSFSTAENQILKKIFPFYQPPLLTYESTNK